MEIINIILTEDKEIFRNALREMLRPFPVKILAEAENGQVLLDTLNFKAPDVILLDLEMPVMDGNKAFEIIREKYPHLKIIILSLHYEPELIDDYMERGAKGYIPKDYVTPSLLVNAITKVNGGGTFVFEKPKSKLNLNKKQKEIMPLIFDNHTNEDIAKIMNVSKRTVENQRSALYEKTGTSTAIDFYKFAFSKGLQFLGIKKKL